MSTFMDYLENNQNMTQTTNGDKAFKSTLNANLDMFGSLSSLKYSDEDVVKHAFLKAFREDKNTATKLLFFMRDIRGGEGIRKAFRTAFSYLIELDVDLALKLLPFIPVYGRWDDLVAIYDLTSDADAQKAIMLIIDEQLGNDYVALKANKPVSLLGKWLPSINTSSARSRRLANEIANRLDMRPVDYRKFLSQLRKRIDILETRMTKGDYTFDYSKLPARALANHTKAFLRNDEDRYKEFIRSLKEDVSHLTKKAETLYPYEIYAKAYHGSDEDIQLANALWESLPKDEIKSKFIVVVDTSGSMMCNIPASRNHWVSDVAGSIGVYAAERLTGPFKNKIITFSSNPEFVTLCGKTLREKTFEVQRASWQMNTNIEKTYNLIFEASKNADPKDYIENVLIVSDMQFDACSYVEKSTFERIKYKFEEAGIPFPQMVFWNVNVKETTFPTTDLANATFVSGFSSAMFKQMSEGRVPSALELMMNTLNNYSFVDELFD